jgi:hypothetical protein
VSRSKRLTDARSGSKAELSGMSVLAQSGHSPGRRDLLSANTDFPDFLRASHWNRGAQLALILEATAAFGRFAGLGSSRMAARFTFVASDFACLEPRLCFAYSWPSTGATCGGSVPR